MRKNGIALALSSGGARGLAHIGVLKVLERYQIPILAIAGSSMGGVIGALYSTGYSADMIEDIAKGIRRSHWIDFSVSRMGLLAGKKLEGLINLFTQGKTFEDCQPPLQVVAVDIEKGSEVILKSGPLAQAIRATASIPGIFSPVVMEGRILVDGGIINRVPVNVIKSVPNSIVVAVDVGVDLAPRVQSMFDVLFQTFDIMARELRQCQPIDADVVIEPHVGFSRESHVSHVEEIIRAGEKACEQAIPYIQQLLNDDQGGVQ
ncbi:patatin-like phospholipase family protein [Sulfobacillus thermosulfidooxidans]|uniref:patatin-like phospholipase family protein n=1 Tax=Sulfobacillus thermosulfidooxidans TaxID=28034 RepID=UPI0006B5FF30|nr:patatin-like phospholipase family protein [Sulfobacillus thermosulfidooxidans]